MASRIVLDQDNEEIINRVSLEINRSASAIVNDLLRRIEIVVPNRKKVELQIEDMDINKVKKNEKRN